MIVGHQKNKDLFDSIIAKEVLAQAYLFFGPEKVGKKTFALDVCRRISGVSEGGILPGLLHIKPEIEEKAEKIVVRDMGVERIREIKHDLGLTFGSEKRKFCIIEDAERMTKAAQNSMLKILEEPKDNVTFFIICNDKEKMLPTIISRCQKVSFGIVSEREMAEFVPKNIPEREAIIFWSLGRPGLARELMEQKEALDFRKKCFSDFKILFGSDVPAKMEIAEELGKNKGKAISELELFLVVLRQSLVFPGKVKIPEKKAFRLLEKISSGIEKIGGTNANLRLALENIFLDF